MKRQLITFLLFIACGLVSAQDLSHANMAGTDLDSMYHGMKWRNVGPTRGGRVTTVCGVISDPFTYYMGSTGGGVWKTTDAGASWTNVSDGYFNTGSVGAIAVAPSDPNVIYVGMGEAAIRGVMTSHGDGVYRSTDAGQSWMHLGLEDTRQISAIQVHPHNPDLVYVAAQGSPYKATIDRGVFRSEDGGANWEKVHYVDSTSGVSSLSMDVVNPRILYAAYWDHQRLPWHMRSGGPGSGFWKSTNGGDDWSELTQGLPDSIMGKIGIAVSPADNSRVYAIIESEQGGFYRSDNAGKSWKLVNGDRILRARSWYYMHVFADPQDVDKVAVLNAPFMLSKDGGKSFSQLPTPHGDNHALWINPNNNQVMINGNDGGANISFNGGKSWSTQRNQPTAQFYRLNVDNRYPYHLYGGQQDNSTVCIPNAATGPGIPYRDFYSVGGCESAYTAFDPDNPRFVYAGCYQGIISEYDTKLKVGKDIMAYPHLGLGEHPSEMRYRFNWNAPILMSRHDKSVIYHAGNQVLKTIDRGVTWQEISPDLTKASTEKLVAGGGPITNEGAGGENYHTILYLAESPHSGQVLWAGSDDGLIHLTADGGANWKDVTPRAMEEGMVNAIEVSPHDPATAFVAFTRYKFDDYSPHVFVTRDFGATWTDMHAGIGEKSPVRVVREDPERQHLLYAGTETGLYISTNGGENWHQWQLNLPVVPITDMMLRHGDLVVSTAGRAFWVLDDLRPLREWDDMVDAGLYAPDTAYLWGGPRKDSLIEMGTNPDFGLMAYYRIPDDWHRDKEVKFVITNQDDKELKSFSTQEKLKTKKITIKQPGVNKLVWNLVPDGVEPIKGLMTLGGNNSPKVGAGEYLLKMMYEEDTFTTSFKVVDDPRLEIESHAFAEKRSWLARLDEAANDLTESVKAMNYVKEQIEGINHRLADHPDTALVMQGKRVMAAIDSIKSELVQEKQKTFQDVINYPNQLDAKIRHIQSLIEGSYPPVTTGQTVRAQHVLDDWHAKKEGWTQLKAEGIHDFNRALKESMIPFVQDFLPSKTPTNIKP